MNVERALIILKEHDLKKTKNRELILQYLERHDRYVSALEVRDYLAKDNPGVSYDTVYRNLATFEDLNIVEATELGGEQHFRMHCDPNTHHHHFICTICGRTETIDYCPMEAFTIHLPGHTIDSHKFELYVKCPKCA